MKKIAILIALAAVFGSCTPEKDYSFDSSISAEVLDNYLSRAITISEFLTPDEFLNEGSYPDRQADVDLILNTGAKFVGRAIY